MTRKNTRHNAPSIEVQTARDAGEFVLQYGKTLARWQAAAVQLNGLAISPYLVGRADRQLPRAEQLAAEIDAGLAKFQTWQDGLRYEVAQNSRVRDAHRALLHLKTSIAGTVALLRHQKRSAFRAPLDRAM